jgi:hypothetical protein
MDMTPAKMAFIKGQSEVEPLPPIADPAAKAAEETIEIEVSKKETESTKEPAARISRRSNRRSNQDAPNANEVLDQVLVPVTIRLSHRTAQALRRAYLEQRLKHVKPDTQQEITEDALTDWLLRSGYLD